MIDEKTTDEILRGDLWHIKKIYEDKVYADKERYDGMDDGTSRLVMGEVERIESDIEDTNKLIELIKAIDSKDKGVVLELMKNHITLLQSIIAHAN